MKTCYYDEKSTSEFGEEKPTYLKAQLGRAGAKHTKPTSYVVAPECKTHIEVVRGSEVGLSALKVTLDRIYEPESTSITFDDAFEVATTTSRPNLTAVIQLSPNEDDVLEIYAEDLDRETLEFIDRI